MNNRVLTMEEERFIVDTLLNLAFDMLDSGDETWEPCIDEIDQALEIFGRSRHNWQSTEEEDEEGNG